MPRNKRTGWRTDRNREETQRLQAAAARRKFLTAKVKAELAAKAAKKARRPGTV